MSFHHLRREYQQKQLLRSELASSPYDQFRKWFSECLNAKIEEANAMCLSTATSSGIPSGRMVLMKQFDESGVYFFTNYESRKSREILENPFASLTFFWKEFERQVLIEGRVEIIPRVESEFYFRQRPRGSQMTAWASHQDAIIESREHLEEEVKRIESLYQDQSIPAPLFWGGFRLIPHRFEFWQGRADRLHDRYSYTLIQGKWEVHCLAP